MQDLEDILSEFDELVDSSDPNAHNKNNPKGHSNIGHKRGLDAVQHGKDKELDDTEHPRKKSKKTYRSKKKKHGSGGKKLLTRAQRACKNMREKPKKGD